MEERLELARLLRFEFRFDGRTHTDRACGRKNGSCKGGRARAPARPPSISERARPRRRKIVPVGPVSSTLHGAVDALLSASCSPQRYPLKCPTLQPDPATNFCAYTTNHAFSHSLVMSKAHVLFSFCHFHLAGTQRGDAARYSYSKPHSTCTDLNSVRLLQLYCNTVLRLV